MPWFIALVFSMLLSGWALQALLKGRACTFNREAIAMSLPLGTAVLGTLFVFGLIMFDRLLVSLVYWIPLILTVSACFRFRGPAHGGGVAEAGAAQQTRLAPGEGGAALQSNLTTADWIFIAGAAVFTVLLMLIAFKDGVYGDALSLWGYKAVVLAESESLRIPAFLDADYYHHHKDYPLLFPSIHAALYELSGTTLDRTAKLLYPLLLLFTALYLYFQARREASVGAAWLAGGLCIATPAMCGFHPGICSAYMDIPLGCFTVLALLSGRAWLNDGRRTDSFVAGFFLTAMALTKNEGIAAAALGLILLVGAGLMRRRAGRWTGLCGLLLPVALFGGSWLIFKAALPAGQSQYFSLSIGSRLLDNAPRLPHAAGAYLLELIHFERWGFLWILVVLLAPAWLRNRGSCIGLFLGGMIAIQIAAIALSPLEIRYQTASVVFRLPGQLAPLAAICVGLGYRAR